MEVISVILMFVFGNMNDQEHRIQESMSECLKGKRLAERDINVNVQYMCGKVDAVLEDNIDGSKSIKKIVSDK